MESATINYLFKILVSLIFVGALIFWVIPTIFGIAIRIIFELFILFIYFFIGYILIKALENVWKLKRGK